MISRESSKSLRRSGGVLMHVTSLPGPYGIGDLGPSAHAWVDALADAGQAWWQVLPLGPAGEGNSPYNCYSAFAGNPNLISPDALVAEGLVTRSDLRTLPSKADRADFGRSSHFRRELLDLAWRNFRGGAARKLRGGFDQFRSESAAWLDDFSLFMALREAHAGQSWTQWPKDLVLRRAPALREARQKLRDEIDRQQFSQFLFFRQLGHLRDHAKRRGVKLIGDVPIFVSPESADVWANPHLFRLDAHRRPKVVAGVPPDYFSKTGQRWGNPLYNWPAHQRENFRWWVARVRASLAQADLLRIDHFRGFAACWEIPASAPTAQKGRWVKSPGEAMLRTFQKELGGLPLIAEDLGLITPDVEALRDGFGLPGMRVLQFAFGGDSANPHLPHNAVPNSIMYTGTHDNDTTTGWWRSAPKDQKAKARRYAPGLEKDIPCEMIRLAWASVSNVAITPVQDLLGLGSKARMNTPGQAEGNWGWRMPETAKVDRPLERLAELTELYGRRPV
ncbi:MAG TPA: 4-alpha-glucanotransferase [Tepidisphaeraceae bacterium]